MEESASWRLALCSHTFPQARCDFRPAGTEATISRNKSSQYESVAPHALVFRSWDDLEREKPYDLATIHLRVRTIPGHTPLKE
eukprot:137417-Chlamydomonas_euryale.AAC.10